MEEKEKRKVKEKRKGKYEKIGRNEMGEGKNIEKKRKVRRTKSERENS